MTTRDERLKAASHRRRQRVKQELRSAILSAAGDLILEYGYERFSLRQVAERIGYSATAIYLHFEDKDALVAAVIEEGFARFLQALEAVKTEDPAERIADLGRAYVRFGLRNRVHYQLMFMQRGDLLMRPLDGAAENDSPSFLVLQNSVQRAIDTGVLRPGDARTYSLVYWATVHGVVSLVIGGVVPLDDATVERITEIALEMCHRGFRQE